jgi:hypothetical protein
MSLKSNRFYQIVDFDRSKFSYLLQLTNLDSLRPQKDHCELSQVRWNQFDLQYLIPLVQTQ